MARRHPLLQGTRRSDDEDMVVSGDQRSVRKGRRVAPRTEVCRPCLIWRLDTPDLKTQAVVLNLNPHGILLRSLEPFPVGEDIQIQMMRDDEFKVPLSQPITLHVVRSISAMGGFVDLGTRVHRPRIKRAQELRPIRNTRPAAPRPTRARMHTLDTIVADRNGRRGGR